MTDKIPPPGPRFTPPTVPGAQGQDPDQDRTVKPKVVYASSAPESSDVTAPYLQRTSLAFAPITFGPPNGLSKLDSIAALLGNLGTDQPSLVEVGSELDRLAATLFAQGNLGTDHPSTSKNTGDSDQKPNQ